eukprot:g1814.t1
MMVQPSRPQEQARSVSRKRGRKAQHRRIIDPQRDSDRRGDGIEQQNENFSARNPFAFAEAAAMRQSDMVEEDMPAEVFDAAPGRVAERRREEQLSSLPKIRVILRNSLEPSSQIRFVVRAGMSWPEFMEGARQRLGVAGIGSVRDGMNIDIRSTADMMDGEVLMVVPLSEQQAGAKLLQSGGRASQGNYGVGITTFFNSREQTTDKPKGLKKVPLPPSMEDPRDRIQREAAEDAASARALEAFAKERGGPVGINTFFGSSECESDLPRGVKKVEPPRAAKERTQGLKLMLTDSHVRWRHFDPQNLPPPKRPSCKRRIESRASSSASSRSTASSGIAIVPCLGPEMKQSSLSSDTTSSSPRHGDMSRQSKKRTYYRPLDAAERQRRRRMSVATNLIGKQIEPERRTISDLVRTSIGSVLNWEGNTQVKQRRTRQQWLASRPRTQRRLAKFRKGKKKNPALGEV